MAGDGRHAGAHAEVVSGALGKAEEEEEGCFLFVL